MISADEFFGSPEPTSEFRCDVCGGELTQPKHAGRRRKRHEGCRNRAKAQRIRERREKGEANPW